MIPADSSHAPKDRSKYIRRAAFSGLAFVMRHLSGPKEATQTRPIHGQCRSEIYLCATGERDHTRPFPKRHDGQTTLRNS